MSMRAFLVLLALTIASLALAAYAVVTRDVPVASLALNRPLLPDLAGQIEQVAEITVRTSRRSMTARRTETGWVLAEAADYPVDPEQIRGIVLGLAEMQVLEAKTDRPEKLARLELEPVASEGAKSRLVILRAADGTPLAEVVLGKQRFSLYGPGKAGMYVRLAQSNQAWLADRAIDLPDEPIDWLERKLLQLDKDQIAEILLQPDTAQAVLLRRLTPEQADFELVDLPAGRELDADRVGQLAGVFTTLSMLDIARSADKPWPEPIGRAVYRTFAGLEIEVTVAKLGEGDSAEWWVQLAAREREPLARPPHAGAAAAAADMPRGEQAQAGSGRKLDVGALAHRFHGRAFKVASYLAERFTWTQDNLLKPAAEKQDNAS